MRSQIQKRSQIMFLINCRVSSISTFLFVFLCMAVFTAPTANAQIDPAKCGESVEKSKQCITGFVQTLKDLKKSNQDLVGLLKLRNKSTPSLETKYEAARSQVSIVIALLTRRSPDFTSVKREFDLATTQATDFANDANTTLTGTQGAGLGIPDGLVTWFFANGCKVLPNDLAKEGCNELVKFVNNLRLKKEASWEKWSKIKPGVH